MIESILSSAHCTSGGRRILTSEQKRVIVEEWERSGDSGPEFSRRHGLLTTMLYRWRKDAMRGAKMGIQHDGELYTKVELETLRAENDELKKALAESTLDNRILKKKLELDARKQALRKSSLSNESSP